MPKVFLRRGNITFFKGDGIVIPSDVELTNKKVNKVAKAVLEIGNENLIKEVSSIGYCEIGNAVITQGHNLRVKHLIFLPYCDSNTSENKIDFILLHKALRSAFNLATLYNIKTLAIPIFRPEIHKFNFIEKALNTKLLQAFFEEAKTTRLNESEIEDIIINIVVSEFKKTGIKEVFIYK